MKHFACSSASKGINSQDLENDACDTKHYVHNIFGIFSDKMYVLNSSLIEAKCMFCRDFSTKMCIAACGHKYCLSCIYEDLAGLCIAKCPYCSKIGHGKRPKPMNGAGAGAGAGAGTGGSEKANETNDDANDDGENVNADASKQKPQCYVNSPSSNSATPQQTLYLNPSSRHVNRHFGPFNDLIFPVYDDTGQLPHQTASQQAAVILCRFHEDISPIISTCQESFPLTEDGLQRYYEHFLLCYKNVSYESQSQLEASHMENQKKLAAQRFNERAGEANASDSAHMKETQPKTDFVVANNVVLMGNISPIGPMNADCLPYSISFYSAECRRLFKAETEAVAGEQLVVQKDVFTVFPNRNPFVGHIILRKLIFDILERRQLSLQRDFWNCQIVFFINPYESIDFWVFSNVTLGLQVEAPDGRSSTFEFIVDREQLYKHRIMRFYMRVLTFYEGRYTFTLRWSCTLPNAQTGTCAVFQSSEQVSAFVAKPVLGPDLSPVSLEAFLSSNPPIHPALLGLLSVAHDVLLRGYRHVDNESPKDLKQNAAAFDPNTELRNLTPKDIEALYLYAAYCHTVKDGCLFCIGCRAYASVRESALLLNTSPFLHALISVMDRYCEVEVIQTPALELVHTLGTTLPNFFSSTPIVGSSLLGRLRRIKHIFKDTSRSLQNLLYEISKRAYYVLPLQTDKSFKDVNSANALTRLYINREILNTIPYNDPLSLADALHFYLAALCILKNSRVSVSELNISAVVKLINTQGAEPTLYKFTSLTPMKEEDAEAFYISERAKLTPMPGDWKECIMLHIVGYLCGIWKPTYGLQIMHNALLGMIVDSCSGDGKVLSLPSYNSLRSVLSSYPGEFLELENVQSAKNISIVRSNIEFLQGRNPLSIAYQFMSAEEAPTAQAS